MSRVLNDHPGVGPGDPAGRADRPRRARLRAPGAAAQAQRRPGRPGRAGAGQPDLPGVRPGHRVDAGPAAASPRCCAPRPPAASPRTSTSRCCSTGRSPGSSSSPACTPTPPPTTTATAALIARPLPIVLINGYVAGHRRALRLLRRPGGRRAGRRPPGRARAPADRPDHRPGPVRAGAAQARRLPRRDDPAGSASPTPSWTSWSSCHCSAWRAARRPPAGCSTAASPASSAAPT